MSELSEQVRDAVLAAIASGVVGVEKGFNPNEPRDAYGRWTETGAAHAHSQQDHAHDELQWRNISPVAQASPGGYIIRRDARTGVHVATHTDPKTKVTTHLGNFGREHGRGGAQRAAREAAQEHYEQQRAARAKEQAEKEQAEKEQAEKPVHPFERAGLGKAPFRFVGMVDQPKAGGLGGGMVSVGEVNGVEVLTTPGGSCDYCGQGIIYMFGVESSDGRRFKVGCDCVHKIADADPKLVRAVDAEVRRINRQKRVAKDQAGTQEIHEILTAHKDALAAIPHPQKWRADKGETALDYAQWMLRNAGMSGRGDLLRTLRKMLNIPAPPRSRKAAKAAAPAAGE